ncbi:hypothetical protein OWV82_010460 [Melia azedarach]|uniref:Uncharacterized protein n=1 Tax=Melia azedarach TaxID=155640 RepID=A0ACC1Y6H5_MELAZ|nr:hypothetical protein OWV82_010460 [Melia azedarach]
MEVLLQKNFTEGYVSRDIREQSRVINLVLEGMQTADQGYGKQSLMKDQKTAKIFRALIQRRIFEELSIVRKKFCIPYLSQ